LIEITPTHGPSLALYAKLNIRNDLEIFWTTQRLVDKTCYLYSSRNSKDLMARGGVRNSMLNASMTAQRSTHQQPEINA
jgi:hypothetical protein